MKKLFFSLIALVAYSLIGYSQTGEKIGVFKDGKYVITENLDNLTKRWNQILINNKISGELTSFEIRYNVDEQSADDNYYFLIANTKDNSVKMVEILLLENGVFKLPADSGHTVTCSGCVAGCSPKKMRSIGWVCTAGCEACSKSETVSD